MNYTEENLLEALSSNFGYSSFQLGQKESISSLLHGNDVLAVMPTGAGKSLCYQLPALMLSGVALIISPLISLMKNQVDALKLNGVKAEFLNSSLDDASIANCYLKIANEEINLLYVAPERLENTYFKNMIADCNISLIAVDEAHCVSRWGHDFRPSYIKISTFIESLKTRPPVIALTATATPSVKKDVASLLKLKNPTMISTGFDRPNLTFEVYRNEAKYRFIMDIIKQNSTSTYTNLASGQKSGIIYASTRKDVDRTYEFLKEQGVSAGKYHAGLTPVKRTQMQNDFQQDNIKVMVATNAFGLGIDKPDIRFIIHYNMPGSLEAYYQEAGRAGRDGNPSRCILLYSPGDVLVRRRLIEYSDMGEEFKVIEYEKLSSMMDYTHTANCLRHVILDYFGDNPLESDCQNCGNCLSPYENVDITIQAQMILSGVYRATQNYSLGLAIIVEMLKGAKTKNMTRFNLTRLSTYGIMKDLNKDTIRDLANFLAAEGYIKIASGKFPTASISEKGMSFIKENQQLLRKMDKTVMDIKPIAKAKQSYKQSTEYDESLYENLRELRYEIASELGKPAFVVMSNKTLEHIAEAKPITMDEFLDIYGIGEAKADAYADAFIDIVLTYNEEHGAD